VGDKMNKYPDVKIGNTYGKLTVIGKGKIKYGKQHWICECSCKNQTIKEILGDSLKHEKPKVADVHIMDRDRIKNTFKHFMNGA
jgi:hypothetical protein